MHGLSLKTLLLLAIVAFAIVCGIALAVLK